jgi:AGCS family alanine or glycine:cation symporter
LHRSVRLRHPCGLEFLRRAGRALPAGRKGAAGYRLLFIAAVVLGCTLRLETVWNVSDILNGLLALPNLVGVLFLRGQVMEEMRRYL